MKVEKIGREELEAAIASKPSRKYREVYTALRTLKPGESLKVELDDKNDAKRCKAAVINLMRKDKTEDKTIFKSFQMDKTCYFYPSIRVVQ